MESRLPSVDPSVESWSKRGLVTPMSDDARRLLHPFVVLNVWEDGIERPVVSISRVELSKGWIDDRGTGGIPTLSTRDPRTTGRGRMIAGPPRLPWGSPTRSRTTRPRSMEAPVPQLLERLGPPKRTKKVEGIG